MKDRYFGNILVVVGIVGFIGLLLNGCSKNLVQEIQKSGQLNLSSAPPSFTRILSATHRTPGEIRVAWDKARDTVTPTDKMTYRVYFLKDAGNLESRQLLKTLTGENELYISDARARGVSTLLIEAVNQFGRSAQQMVTVQPAPADFQSTEPVELVNVSGTVENPGDPNRTVYIGLFNSEESPTQSRGNVHPFAMTSGSGPEIPFIFSAIPRGTKVWIGAYLDTLGKGAIGPTGGDVVGFWPTFSEPQQVVAGSQPDNLRFRLSDRLVGGERRVEVERIVPTTPAPAVILPESTPVVSVAPTPAVILPEPSLPIVDLPTTTPVPSGRQIIRIDIRIEGKISTRKPDEHRHGFDDRHREDCWIPPDHTLRLPVSGLIHLRDDDIGKTLLVFAVPADEPGGAEGRPPVVMKKYTVNDDHMHYELGLEVSRRYWIRASVHSDDDGMPEPGDRKGGYREPVNVEVQNRNRLENIDFLLGEDFAFCPAGHPMPVPPMSGPYTYNMPAYESMRSY